MSPSALLQSPPFQQPPLGLCATSAQMGSWEIVYLPQMKSWDIGCFLQYSFLPLIIPLHFHSHVAWPLLLLNYLFPNASLVTRRKQKHRRWFIQTKMGFELPSVLHFFATELGKLPVQSRPSSTNAFPRCYPKVTPIFFEARTFTVKKHPMWWFFCRSEAKESLWLGWMQGGKSNSSLNLRCLLISCIPVEKSWLKTQVVKTSLVFSTNAGGSMAVLSQSGVELAFRRSLFPI